MKNGMVALESKEKADGYAKQYGLKNYKILGDRDEWHIKKNNGKWMTIENK